MVKYPNIKVQLSGEDGNVFSVLGRCIKAAKRNGLPDEQIKQFKEEAMSGDYDHLLRTCMEWFNCD